MHQRGMERLTAACILTAGVSFVPSSPLQVADLIHNKLKILKSPNGFPENLQGALQGTSQGAPRGALRMSLQGPPSEDPQAESPGAVKTRQLCTDDHVLQANLKHQILNPKP